MNPAVYDEVMARDKVCVLSFLEEGHQCRDVWGTPHAPDQFPSYEHVKRDLALGIKKVDDPRWGVRLCGYANNRPPTKAQRGLFRDYLAHTEHTAPVRGCWLCQAIVDGVILEALASLR